MLSARDPLVIHASLVVLAHLAYRSDDFCGVLEFSFVFQFFCLYPCCVPAFPLFFVLISPLFIERIPALPIVEPLIQILSESSWAQPSSPSPGSGPRGAQQDSAQYRVFAAELLDELMASKQSRDDFRLYDGIQTYLRSCDCFSLFFSCFSSAFLSNGFCWFASRALFLTPFCGGDANSCSRLLQAAFTTPGHPEEGLEISLLNCLAKIAPDSEASREIRELSGIPLILARIRSFSISFAALNLCP